MRSVQVSKPNGSFELVEREIPEPGDRKVRIKIQACGICNGDSVTKQGIFIIIMLAFDLGLRMYLRICWGCQKDDRGEVQEASAQDDLDAKQSRLSDFLD